MLTLGFPKSLTWNVFYNNINVTQGFTLNLDYYSLQEVRFSSDHVAYNIHHTDDRNSKEKVRGTQLSSGKPNLKHSNNSEKTMLLQEDMPVPCPQNVNRQLIVTF